mmetsp:Transcript_12851/g.40356  ORF Transcript_12851/g.40356 Transcript_12851/m.40356 type:complete len:817 (-) Transcript_12851:81-2531(-)
MPRLKGQLGSSAREAQNNASLPSITTLLASIASQHERLSVKHEAILSLSTEFSSALCSAQVSVAQLQVMLQQSRAEELTRSTWSSKVEDIPLQRMSYRPLPAPPEVPRRDRLESNTDSILGMNDEEGLESYVVQSLTASSLQASPTAGRQNRWWDRSPPKNGESETQGDSTSEIDEERLQVEVHRSSTKSQAVSHASVDSWRSLEHSSAARRNAILRVQARLGVPKLGGYVSAHEVHRAVAALGLERFSEYDAEILLRRLDEAYSATMPEGTARWTFAARPTASKIRLSGLRRAFDEEMEDSTEPTKLKFNVFIDALLNDDLLFSRLEPELVQQALTVREVLFSGDANRLVAELTQVRVDDLAAPLDRPEFISYIEPVVGIAILLNGLLVGLQTDVSTENWPGWFWLNLAFAIFFTVEIALRAGVAGCNRFLTGSERVWNVFDTGLIIVGVIDVMFEAVSSDIETGSLTVMRILRLTRLTRLLRIFRLRYMKELSLMVKGLLAGLRTLLWAVVLLFITLYVLAIFTTMTLSKSEAPGILEDGLFTSVGNSVLTAFRCFVGDCNTSKGRPITKLLADAYGWYFVVPYFASMVFVTFGLFNLIVAIYIESTMNAAKMTEEKGKMQRKRESIRIAHLTRQLLKKFCAAQSLFLDKLTLDSTTREVRKMLRCSMFDDVDDIAIPVSKEMFLLVIQDSGVQKLMDDLDIPPDRASLFDILDADGSGGLEVTELIQGLLRVRGEAKKSDVIGSLLAVRAVQNMLRQQSALLEALSAQCNEISRRVPEDPVGQSVRRSGFRSSCSAPVETQFFRRSGGQSRLV